MMPSSWDLLPARLESLAGILITQRKLAQDRADMLTQPYQKEIAAMNPVIAEALRAQGEVEGLDRALVLVAEALAYARGERYDRRSPIDDERGWP